MLRNSIGRFGIGIAAVGLLVVPGLSAWAEKPQSSVSAEQLSSPEVVARAVDELIEKHLKEADLPLAPLCRDEDFLRRASLDLVGTIPSVQEVTFFGLNPSSTKRAEIVQQLLNSEKFGQNWGRYWRDVIFSRATDLRARITEPAFEDWMAQQLNSNTSWDEIAIALITATGDVRENGATAILFAQGAEAPEIAAETSRIFLGIQIQCANCHDHPTDQWTRKHFHELAAYFPRIRIIQSTQPNTRSFEVVSANSAPRRGQDFLANPERIYNRLDANQDGKLSKDEVANSPLAGPFERILRVADANQDQMISREEFQNIPRPQQQRRGAGGEYYMPDLTDPASRGTLVDPVFFLNQEAIETGLDDLDRRERLARQITSPDNPWFARAFVNRIWGELLGEGFSMPIDDIGPQRAAQFPEVLDLLSAGLIESGYDVKWLFQTIMLTETYQRKLGSKPHWDSPSFAMASPSRLRGDQIFDSLNTVLGVDLEQISPNRGQGSLARVFGARSQFNQVFGHDPSTPQDELTGTVPQALFLMNSPLINNLISARNNTRLAQILNTYDDDEDAIAEVYLLVLSREPTSQEITICKDYLSEVKNRNEAFEDLMWSLLNSSEFLSKR